MTHPNRNRNLFKSFLMNFNEWCSKVEASIKTAGRPRDDIVKGFIPNPLLDDALDAGPPKRYAKLNRNWILQCLFKKKKNQGNCEPKSNSHFLGVTSHFRKDMIHIYLSILSILFYSILFYSILFYAMLCYAMLCYSILFYSILSILFYSILFYSILFYSILFYSILFYLFYSIYSIYSIYLSIYLSVCLSIYLSIYRPIYI